MTSKAIEAIERELMAFDPGDQEKIGGDIASYLRRLSALRRELARGERDLEEGRTESVADLENAIRVLRRQHAGG